MVKQGSKQRRFGSSPSVMRGLFGELLTSFTSQDTEATHGDEDGAALFVYSVLVPFLSVSIHSLEKSVSRFRFTLRPREGTPLYSMIKQHWADKGAP